MPKEVRASFILSVETDELFINAGLQDRVVQVDYFLKQKLKDKKTNIISKLILLIFFI